MVVRKEGHAHLITMRFFFCGDRDLATLHSAKQTRFRLSGNDGGFLLLSKGPAPKSGKYHCTDRKNILAKSAKSFNLYKPVINDKIVETEI